MRSIKGLHLHNTYYVMRHEESFTNAHHIISSSIKEKYALTKKGKRVAQRIVGALCNKTHIDLAFVSPVYRTKKTFQIVKNRCGHIPVTYDKRLIEIRFGIFENKSIEEYNNYFGEGLNREGRSLNTHPPKGETLEEVQSRMVDIFREINGKYKNKKILIISHGDPLWLLRVARKGILTKKKIWKTEKTHYMNPGRIYALT